MVTGYLKRNGALDQRSWKIYITVEQITDGWEMRQKRLWGCWRGRTFGKVVIRLADDA